jgi:tripartite-type tricarboxylate transporter receptor subunit TctC
MTTTLARLAAAFALLLAGNLAADAGSYPVKPVRLVVPAPPGGTLDLIGRIIADGLRPGLGQPIIIENKPGGAGMLGVMDLLSNPHDGHTVLIHINGIVSEIPHLAKPPYDPFKAIEPQVVLARSGLVFVGNTSLPADDLARVIAYIKANPGKINYGSYSPGTVSHTLGVEFNKYAGLDMTHVGYKGSPPALQDLMGNQVQVMFDGPATSVGLVKGGKIKAFAVTSPQRNPALPNVPTFAELGFEKMTQVSWVGLWTTPDVPAEVKDRLRKETQKALQNATLRERIGVLGMEPGGSETPEALQKDLREGYDRQAAVLKSINFKPE